MHVHYQAALIMLAALGLLYVLEGSMLLPRPKMLLQSVVVAVSLYVVHGLLVG